MRNGMIFQVTWKILPGLRGLSCGEFRAVATQSPDNERGVAVELASDAEREALIRQLEEQFATQRFSNNAAAFEAVKACVLAWPRRGTDERCGTTNEHV